MLFILNGKIERELQEKKNDNYLGSSTYYGQDVKKESLLLPRAAVMSCLQGVSGAFRFSSLEAQATLPTYGLWIICHSESWHIPEQW